MYFLQGVNYQSDDIYMYMIHLKADICISLKKAIYSTKVISKLSFPQYQTSFISRSVCTGQHNRFLATLGNDPIYLIKRFCLTK